MIGGESKRSGLLALGLFVSLAVNFFFAGWLIGKQSSFIPPPPPFDRVFNERLRNSLSPEGAQRMQKAFEAIRRRFMDHENEVRSSRERIDAILKADRFDAAAYLAATKAMHEEREHDRNDADEELLRAISQLSLEDRRKLADMHRGPPGPPPPPPGPGFGG